MKTNKLLPFFFLLGMINIYSQNMTSFFTSADAFFNVNVSNGKVAYDQIKTNQNDLNALVEFIETVSLSEMEATTIKAFYINTYNILVIKGIIDNYPLKSPLDKTGFFDSITYKVSGELLTLNDIENKKIRAQFGDARIHFVLVCGAIGCPPLIDQAYLPSTLNSQLQKQTVKALNNPNFVKLKKNKVQLSQIFNWYKDDFLKNGNEIDYLNRFRKTKIDSKAKISYYPYNWSLNQQ